MSDTVTLKVTILGDGTHTFNMPAGTTLAELIALAEVNEHMEFRVGGEKVAEDTAFTEDTNIVGVKPVKGGTR